MVAATVPPPLPHLDVHQQVMKAQMPAFAICRFFGPPLVNQGGCGGKKAVLLLWMKSPNCVREGRRVQMAHVERCYSLHLASGSVCVCVCGCRYAEVAAGRES
jgi:hypothetical protein